MLAPLVVLASNSRGFSTVYAAEREPVMTTQSVKTYLNYSDEVDPARILTIADQELSAALASPLVEFNAERQITSALAEKWSTLSSDRIAFTLRRGLKWSDGTPVHASEYQASFERAKRLYGQDLKALFDSVSKIEAVDDHTLVITTHGEVAKSGILLKLTEPMYGLLAIKGNAIDLSKSIGPFYVQSKVPGELVLARNPHWYGAESGMPPLVEIRRPKESADLISTFESDPWANLVSGTSLMPSENLERLKKNGYRIWQRSLDKVLSLYPSRRFLKNGGAELVKKFAVTLDRKALMEGFGGYSSADQFFPRGYELYSLRPAKVEAPAINKYPHAITVFFPNASVVPVLQDRIVAALKGMGAEVMVEVVPLMNINERLVRGDFDILVTPVAVADPNFEGAMSFFIEREPPIIQSTPGINDCSQQVKRARGLPMVSERADRMREIIIHAQEAGYVLPLIHFSSVAVSKPGVDISNIPNSDETINFAKVRMR